MNDLVNKINIDQYLPDIIAGGTNVLFAALIVSDR